MSNTDHPRWRIARWTAVGGILLIPLVAMQFTTEVHWTAGDFAAAALLLGGAMLAWEAVLWSGAAGRRRLGLGAAIGLALLTVWAELAVGIFP